MMLRINSPWQKLFAAVLLCAFLAACKSDLYSGLSEEDGNQMIALLQSRGIEAFKEPEKGGTLKLRVEREHFAEAVELLRMHGFPKRKKISMIDVFPSGQLVTSPLQERAKMIYLKEQQLESMLSSMDGVITASVSIGQATDDAGKYVGDSSVSVFVKYSPEINMANRETEIKRLLMDSVPDMAPERISVVLQPAMLRHAAAARTERVFFESIRNNLPLTLALASIAVLLFSFAGAYAIRHLRKRAAA